MAITFNTSKMPSAERKIWRGEAKMLPAGFKCKQTFPAGTTLLRGLPVFVDMSDLSAAVCKLAKVISGGTTTKPRVTKGANFVVGDIVTKVGHGEKSPSITAIDTSNSGYDVLTLSAAYTGLTADDILCESTAYGYYDAESTDEGALKVVASGATTGQINLASVTPYNGTKTLAANDYVVLKLAEPLYVPNAVLGEDREILASDLPTLDVAWGALVIKDVAPMVLDDWMAEGGLCLKNNHNIVYIRQ